jgi:HSP20 family protein
MLSVQRWNPWRELEEMRAWMNELQSQFGLDTEVTRSTSAPSLDVVEDENHMEFHVDLPGIAPENVQITVQNGLLSISAETRNENEQADKNFVRRERYYGSYRRSLRIPDSLDAENAQADFEHGVLKLSFPKKPEAQARRIPIQGVKDTPVLEGGKA